MSQIPEHPGVVHYTNAATGESNPRAAGEMPLSEKFVFRRKGVECASPEEADEIIPVVEVRMTPLSAEGKVVPVDDASQVLVVEYGPDDQVLRRTTMDRIPEDRR